MIVAFTVSCMRQKYLRAAVDSWARARGSDKAGFLFCLEPAGTFPVPEFTSHVKQAFPGGALVLQNGETRGCLENTRLAMAVALTLSCDDGFAVVAEEDVEVSDDVLEYFAWARDAYRDDPDVVAVCAHARKSRLPDEHAATRAAWFCPLVWGTWIGRWTGFLAPAWGPLAGSGNRESWDNNLQQLIVRAGKQVVFPVRSRSLHIGELSTLMGTVLGEHVYQASVSDCFSRGYPPGEFREIPYPEGEKLWV